MQIVKKDIIYFRYYAGEIGITIGLKWFSCPDCLLCNISGNIPRLSKYLLVVTTLLSSIYSEAYTYNKLALRIQIGKLYFILRGDSQRNCSAEQ